MNLEWAEKWATALESGDYTQGQGLLHSEKQGICCLGVLCEIVGAKRLAEPSNSKFGKIFYYGDQGDIDKSILPKSVQDLVGMQTRRGWIPSLSSGLAVMNDDGESFVSIAKIIRKHAAEL